MTPLVPIALFGWVPVVAVLFALLPARRAVLVAFIGAWLFLPIAGYSLPGVPNYTKTTATCLGVLMAIVAFDGGRLMTFRPSLLDLPAVGWCISPLLASLTNGLGLYDGLAGVSDQVTTWGIPYFVGRLYFGDALGLRELAIAIFVGGLVYMPLCLYEIRMSPQLHTMVYGFHQHSFAQTRRFGGWRPTVFMQHGLGVGMWMAAASLVGIWLWSNRSLVQLGKIPVLWLLPPLLVTTVLCKSLGSLMLLVGGLGVLYASRMIRSRVLLVCLLCVPLVYVGTRATATWSGEELTELARAIGGDQRAGSVETRLDNEDVLVDHALKQPLFGWGGWNRNRPKDVEERTITDGLWVIAVGKFGLFGLSMVVAMMLLPMAMTLRAFPVRTWGHPLSAAPMVLAVLMALYMIDSLLNAVPNPLFTLAGGGLIGASLRRGEAGTVRGAGAAQLRYG